MIDSQFEEQRFIAKVAHMYYQLGLKQTIIARQLDISQATVSRLLRQAVKTGIVQITVTMPVGVYADLEAALCEKYGLKAALVVDCDKPDDETWLQRHIGSTAAHYVRTTLGQSETVGLSSWSSTLLAMVNAMPPLKKATQAQVVQILGGVGNPSAEIYAARLTERFARLVGGTPIYLPAPGVLQSAEMRAALMRDQFVQQAVHCFEQVSLALVGIGSVEPSRLLASSGNVFSAAELTALKQAGAVGDICLRFFDADGKPVANSSNDRVMGMSLEQLKNTRRSVGIAGGQRKIPAIRGALHGGWINVLITDRFTAAGLLDTGV